MSEELSGDHEDSVLFVLYCYHSQPLGAISSVLFGLQRRHSCVDLTRSFLHLAQSLRFDSLMLSCHHTSLFRLMIGALISSEASCSLNASAFLAAPNQCTWRFKDKPRVTLPRLIRFDMSLRQAQGMRKRQSGRPRPC